MNMFDHQLMSKYWDLYLLVFRFDVGCILFALHCMLLNSKNVNVKLSLSPFCFGLIQNKCRLHRYLFSEARLIIDPIFKSDYSVKDPTACMHICFSAMCLTFKKLSKKLNLVF